MSRQYIYTIERLTKKHGQREVLKDIWLSFYPGAKIGVLGRNGSGKSTLLRIMAGHGQGFRRRGPADRRLHRGLSVAGAAAHPGEGRVGQRGGSGRAAAGSCSIGTTRSACQLAEPMDADEMEKLCDELARVQDQIEATDAWELDRQIEIAMDAMNLPAGRRRRRRRSPAASGAASRCASCCLQQAGLAAARRADEPSRCRERRLAGAAPGRVPRHGRGRDARSLLPRQRRQVDSGARPRQGHSVRRQLLVVARAEAGPPGSAKRRQSQARQKTLARELEWVRMSPRARQAKSKARIKAYEKMSAEQFEDRLGRVRNPDSARQAPGRPGRRSQERSARATATRC